MKTGSLERLEFTVGVPYLWGIETCQVFLTINLFVPEYHTYEELRPVIFTFVIFPSFWCGVPYLWGIETYNLQHKLIIRSWSTIPMRNWDIISSLFLLFFSSLEYHTYEELRLFPPCMSMKYCWEYHTYEELRLISVVIFVPQLQEYHTYEELRPFPIYGFIKKSAEYHTYEELRLN